MNKVFFISFILVLGIVVCDRRMPALAGTSYPFERQRAVMRHFADQNPAHSEKNIPDDLLPRLLDWLRHGADPASGC